MPALADIVVVAEEHAPGDLTILTLPHRGVPLPLLCETADVDKMRAAALLVAEATGKTLRLLRYTVREELELIGPG